jgi:hypothetical protein
MFVLFKTFLLLLHLFPSISSLPFSLEILSPLPYTQTNSNLTIKLGFNADASKLFDPTQPIRVHLSGQSSFCGGHTRFTSRMPFNV